MRSSRWGARLCAAFLSLSPLLLPPRVVAHPMGNFSINHYAAIRIGEQQIELRYVIDMAEIPTFQEMQQGGFQAEARDPRVKAYVTARAAAFARGLQLMLGGTALHLRIASESVIFPPGAGNLPTMRMSFLYSAPIPANADCTSCNLVYRDSNFAERAGWKEIIATSGAGVSMSSSSVPARDRSAELANYSTDLLNSPPQDLNAHIIFQRERPAEARSEPSTNIGAIAGHSLTPPVSQTKNPETPAASAPPPAAHSNTPRNAFTELMTERHMSLSFMLLAAFIAAGLGALHALEPGHGKTIVAAYLVGSKGTARNAFQLGLIVTASHTAGVYLLGAITMYAQKYILPERLYPFLAILSGVIIAGMGLYLVLQRFLPGAVAHSHSHTHGGHHHSHGGISHTHGDVPHSHGGISHSHDNVQHSHGDVSHSHGEVSHSHDDVSHTHGDVSHSHDDASHSHQHEGGHSHHHEHPTTNLDPRGVSARQLLLLGITGGMIPCPAALVVLLTAAALGRVGFGLFLIVCFSVGLAAVLIAMGLMAIYAGRLIANLPVEGPLIQRWLPMASAVMITVIGCVIAFRGLMTSSILQGKF